MARVEDRTQRVDRCRTSDQKQRWRAASLLAVEAKFRKAKGYQQMPLLAKALRANIAQLNRNAASASLTETSPERQLNLGHTRFQLAPQLET